MNRAILLSQNFPLIIAAVAFIVLSLLFMGLFFYLRELQQKKERSRKLGQNREHDSMLKDPELTGSAGPDPMSVTGFIHVISKPFMPTPEQPEEYSRMNIKFMHAGLRSSNIRYTFWGTKVILMVFFPFLFYILMLILFPDFKPLYTYILLFYFLVIGFYLPDLWLNFRTRRRKRKIFEGLPDALDLMTVCVEAGVGLDGAIARIGEDLYMSSPELSDELKIVNLEMRAGKPRIEALRNLAIRTDLEDVNSLCTLLIQTDRFGTSLAPALRVYSDTFRTRRFQAAEEAAAKLPVKLLFPLIFFIFPALFVVIMGPAVISFIEYFFKK
jgi:tight adherence protein C